MNEQTLKDKLSSFGEQAEGSEIPALTADQLKLTNPVTTVANALSRLFEADKDVAVSYIYDKEDPNDPSKRVNVWKAKLMVTKADKAEAINQIIVHRFPVAKDEETGVEQMWLDIEVWDCSGETPEMCTTTPAEMTRDGEWECFKTAFKDNRDLELSCFDVTDNFGRVWHFGEFSNRGMSFQNDDLRQKQGFSCMLPVDLLCVFFKGINGVQLATYARA